MQNVTNTDNAEAQPLETLSPEEELAIRLEVITALRSTPPIPGKTAWSLAPWPSESDR